MQQQELELLNEYLHKHFSQAVIDRLMDKPLTGPNGLRRQLGEMDMEYFARAYFPDRLFRDMPEFHSKAYAELQEIVEHPGGHRRVEAAPRGYSKSTRTSLIFPINCILYQRKRYVFIISDTAGQASDFLVDTQGELEGNERIAEDFGNLIGSPWNSTECITKSGVKIESAGSGQKIRGRRHKSFRPDLVLCQPEGNEVLTENGIKDVSEVKAGDKVFTHTGELQTVASNRNRLYSGKLIKIRASGHFQEYTMTDEHPILAIRTQECVYTKGACHLPCYRAKTKNCSRKMYENYKLEFIKANELKKNDILVFPICKDSIKSKDVYNFAEMEPCIYVPKIVGRNKKGQVVDVKSSFEKPKKEDLSFLRDKGFWRLCGYWLAEGSLTRSGKYGFHISFTFNTKETEYVNDIATIVRKCFNQDVTIREIPEKHVVSVRIVSRLLYNFLKPWEVAAFGIKEVPHWVEKLPLFLQKELVIGYWRGDGCVTGKRQEYKIVSVSLRLLNSIQRILLRLGLVSNVRILAKKQVRNICGRECNCKEKYELRVSHEFEKIITGSYDKIDCKRKQWIEGNYLYRVIESVESEEVKDLRVYNFTVKNNKTYCGHLITSHNCDDLENDDLVATTEQRTKLRDWFTKVVLKLGDSYTDIVYVGTILHYDSLLMWALQNPMWTPTIYRAVVSFAERGDLWDEWKEILIDLARPNRQKDALAFFNANKDEMLKGTKVLWPEKQTYYELMTVRITEGEASFNSELQNEPINPEDRLFHCKYYTELPPLEEMTIYGAVDPSMGKTKTADYAPIITLGFHQATGYIYVLEAIIKRLHPDKIIDTIFEQYEIYHHKRFAVETVAFQQFFKDELVKRGAKRGIYLDTKEVHPIKQKELRIQSMQPMINNGFVKFHASQRLLIEQLENFPKASHDDGPDCLEMALGLIKHSGRSVLIKPGQSNNVNIEAIEAEEGSMIKTMPQMALKLGNMMPTPAKPGKRLTTKTCPDCGRELTTHKDSTLFTMTAGKADVQKKTYWQCPEHGWKEIQ